MNDPATVATSYARRAIHELLVSLPAWDADAVRAALTEFERVHRHQVLTEAIALLRQHDGDEWWFDTRDRDAAIGLLSAARTQQEQS